MEKIIIPKEQTYINKEIIIYIVNIAAVSVHSNGSSTVMTANGDRFYVNDKVDISFIFSDEYLKLKEKTIDGSEQFIHVAKRHICHAVIDSEYDKLSIGIAGHSRYIELVPGQEELLKNL